MMGNVWEWNETLLPGYSYRVYRGGSYYSQYNEDLRSSKRAYGNPDREYQNVGFRVASVPEPCSLVLLSLGGLTLMKRRRVR